MEESHIVWNDMTWVNYNMNDDNSHLWMKYPFKSHYTTFHPKLISMFLSLTSALFAVQPPPLLFSIPFTNLLYFFLSFPQTVFVTPVSNQDEGCCAVVWALSSAFHKEEAFHTAECVVDIQRGSILSMHHRDCLSERRARGGDGGSEIVVPSTFQTSLHTFSPPWTNSTSESRGQIKHDKTSPHRPGEQGERITRRCSLCTIFDLYGN